MKQVSTEALSVDFSTDKPEFKIVIRTLVNLLKHTKLLTLKWRCWYLLHKVVMRIK